MPALATVTHTVPVEASGVRHDEPWGGVLAAASDHLLLELDRGGQSAGGWFEEPALKRANRRHPWPSQDACVVLDAVE